MNGHETDINNININGHEKNLFDDKYDNDFFNVAVDRLKSLRGM